MKGRITRGATRLIRCVSGSLEGDNGPAAFLLQNGAPGFQRIIRYGQLSSAAAFLNRERR